MKGRKILTLRLDSHPQQFWSFALNACYIPCSLDVEPIFLDGVELKIGGYEIFLNERILRVCDYERYEGLDKLIELAVKPVIATGVLEPNPTMVCQNRWLCYRDSGEILVNNNWKMYVKSSEVGRDGYKVYSGKEEER